MKWDFIEGVPIENSSGGFSGAVQWVAKVVRHVCSAATDNGVRILRQSATDPLPEEEYDAIVTDPPYYQAISYADLSDFFYVWLRRTIGDSYAGVFDADLTPKSGEIVQHVRADKDRAAERNKYEAGMRAAFDNCYRALKPQGRMVIVFAHKDPAAWESLVGAMIGAGFVVTASWPIDTERTNRSNACGTAALSSSVWLVCRRRSQPAGKGWYKQVQPRMRERITERLRYFWDIGVRGPDFLWAAVGPGLEAFSAYDEVRRNDGKPFTVSEFLREVRRLTTDFALAQIIDGGTEGLDEWTSYALMHRQSFGTRGAPVGECILLSGAYGLDLNSLTGPRGILGKGKGKATASDDEGEEPDSDSDGAKGSQLRLLTWEERTRDDLGEPHPTCGLLCIDMLHRLMREWASGDVTRVAGYAERQGLGQNELFWRVAQAFAEVSQLGSKERGILEALISWGRGRVPVGRASGAHQQQTLALGM